MQKGSTMFSSNNIKQPTQHTISIKKYKIKTNTPSELPTIKTPEKIEPPKTIEPPKEIPPQEVITTQEILQEIKKNITPIEKPISKPKENQQEKPTPSPVVKSEQITPSTPENTTETTQESSTEEVLTEENTPVTDADHFGFNNIVPSYPVISFQIGEHGDVVISYKVSKEGDVLEPQIKQSSGYIRLDRIALREFSKWKFHPAKNIFGTPIETKERTITFSFNIKTQGIEVK